MDNEKTPKNAKNYYCEKCNFICSKQSEFDRHLSTRKHKRITQDNKKTYICLCGNTYRYASGLSKHKNSCIQIKSNTLENSSNEILWTIDPSSNEVKLNENMMYTLFKEMMESNNELITTMAESNQEVITSMTESNQEVIATLSDSNRELKQIILEQQATILELASKPTINNTNSNNNNSHNKTNITINMFLNEQCKDAMTITNFIKSINPSLEQVMYMTNHGNRDGLIQIMNDSLGSMKITERPIHCTDIKRNVNWVKKDEGWIKEYKQESMNRLCLNINELCERTIIELMRADPEYTKSRSDKNELLLKMLIEAHGGAGYKRQINTESAINQMKEKMFLGKDEIRNYREP
jgi:hypothetical protein